MCEYCGIDHTINDANRDGVRALNDQLLMVLRDGLKVASEDTLAVLGLIALSEVARYGPEYLGSAIAGAGVLPNKEFGELDELDAERFETICREVRDLVLQFGRFNMQAVQQGLFKPEQDAGFAAEAEFTIDKRDIAEQLRRMGIDVDTDRVDIIEIDLTAFDGDDNKEN